jgi:hypothetical protein
MTQPRVPITRLNKFFSEEDFDLDISMGEELFVDYGYDPKESHNDVEWYFEQVLHYILGVFLIICDT